MNRVPKPLQILIYQDVLCAWCFIADLRLEHLRREFGDMATWQTRPYPLLVRDSLPSSQELRNWRHEIGLAKREVEGASISDELWRSGDSPRSSLAPLAALEAARLQGDSARDTLARAFQRGALEQGINVTRSDVVFEMAAQIGLNMNRFAAAYLSAQTRSLILQEHRLAVSHGIQGVPTLVINNRWMVSGLKELSEYRELIFLCFEKASGEHLRASERVVH